MGIFNKEGGGIVNIHISEEAKEYLRGMGKNTMTIYTEMISSCWSPRPEIFVRLKEPEALEEFDLFIVDGINIYLYKDAIAANNTIEVRPARYISDLANKEFDVLGLNLG